MTTADKLLSSLKRHNPSKVRAYAGDDDARDIAVPTRRKKWTQVIEAIEARSWSRVELLDKSGAVLGYVDNVEPARELQDLEGKATKSRSDMEWMSKVIISAQREVLTFRDSEHSALLRAQGEVMREIVGAVHGLSAIHRTQLDATRETEAVRVAAAASAAGQGDSLKELLEALPQILQALPMLRALLSQNQAPSAQQKPKNGA